MESLCGRTLNTLVRSIPLVMRLSISSPVSRRSPLVYLFGFAFGLETLQKQKVYKSRKFLLTIFFIFVIQNAFRASVFDVDLRANRRRTRFYNFCVDVDHVVLAQIYSFWIIGIHINSFFLQIINGRHFPTLCPLTLCIIFM